MSALLVNDANGVRTLCFNKPDKLNAINLDMYKQLTEYLIQGESDNDIRAFLIKGSGEHFTSGNDIADFLKGGDLHNNHPAVRFLYCLLEIKKPLIASVSGTAVGIGATILLHCDLAYAEPNAKFQFPFLNLGLIPEAGSTMLLPELVGHQKASELFLLAEQFSAKEALGYGLINKIIDTPNLHEYSEKKAIQIASHPIKAVRETLRLMRPNKHKIQHQMHQELEVFSECLKSEETQQRFSHFFKK
ncbi:enoyl-CoA hydratase/isomerase family protein [Shewanella sp. 202IG2-18]|uniref:enoyl-CoA hydratase-related protein n=1 Tax=Parashewanella hymeniacidonis TaxID=2807618 RepID=UPI0019605F8B|nr:enoyl-CoA hydratase-related protein [Parashewanella hymeniacidonis]MBM7070691.1 enoyl-CoA hydratase/isomerase family protein [Parashewanella hymeniacidonis]